MAEGWAYDGKGWILRIEYNFKHKKRIMYALNRLMMHGYTLLL